MEKETFLFVQKEQRNWELQRRVGTIARDDNGWSQMIQTPTTDPNQLSWFVLARLTEPFILEKPLTSEDKSPQLHEQEELTVAQAI